MAIIRNEEYDRGNLVRCTEFDEFANNGKGELYEIDCKLSSPTRPPTPNPDAAPDWATLKFSFLGNPAYQRISLQSSNLLAVTRLENAILDYVGGANPSYSLLKIFWNETIDGLGSIAKPTASEINTWNAVVIAANMKFRFGTDGKMVLT